MKYIDANRLRKEIDHRIDILEDMSIKCAKNNDTEMHAYYHGKAISLQELLSFIGSFQQEQPSLSDNLDEAVTAQMEEDGDVDYFIRKGIDEIASKYAKLGAEWAMQQLKVE